MADKNEEIELPLGFLLSGHLHYQVEPNKKATRRRLLECLQTAVTSTGRLGYPAKSRQEALLRAG